MNTETAQQSSKTVSADISSLLLPIEGATLLLPGVAVAEIVTFVSPEPNSDEEETPPWFLGSIYWRNQRVPLISFEAITVGATPMVSNHCRIAILNNTGLNRQLNFFAILLQATPKLLRLVSEEIVVNNERILETGEKLHVILAGEEVVIPDIQFIESSIIDYLQLA